MFNAIRQGAQSTPMKILLVVLVLAFISWGVGDYFVGGNSRAPIRVDNTEISLQSVEQLHRQTKEALERQLGQPITPEMTQQLQLPQRVVVDLLRSALLQNIARDLNLAVPDERLHAALTATPAFQTSNTFDAQRYQRTLQSAGYSPAQFERDLRRDLQTQDVNQIFNTLAPYPVTAGLTRLVAQNRATLDVTMLTVPASQLPAPATPDAAMQQAFYEQNLSRFQTQPSWDITLAELLPDTDTHTQTELEDRLAGGESLAQVAAALDLSYTTLTNTQPTALAALLPANARQNVAQLEVGQTSGLLSWRDNRSGYIALNQFNEPQPLDFTEVQADIIATMQQQAQAQQLQQLGQQLVTQAQGATPLQDLAAEHGGTVQEFKNINPEQSELTKLIGQANAAQLRFLPENTLLNRPALSTEAVRLVRVTSIQQPELDNATLQTAQQAYTTALQDESFQLALQALAEDAQIRYNIPALRLVFGNNFNNQQLPQL